MWRIHVRGKKGEFIMSPFIFVLGEFKKKGEKKLGEFWTFACIILVLCLRFCIHHPACSFVNKSSA